jgi:thioredoxin reductase/Pyruvate/2-oxoacid:ferredoxin oxidoreductase delta subunit
MEQLILYAALMAIAWSLYLWRRKALDRAARAQLAQSIEAGLNEPPSLHPVIDPRRCLGSASCIAACPEGAIGMVGGKAALINASACIGHGACQAACPLDAIKLVFGTERRGIEIPRLTPEFETSVPGLFIAGELGGMGLIRKAAEQGRQAIDAIAKRCRAGDGPRAALDRIDVLIVGCGPAGLAAGLAAKAHKLRYRLIEQEPSLGGAVLHYPRHKIAMTSPVKLALVGTMRFTDVRKEQLLEFWQGVVARTQLEIRFGEGLQDIAREANGGQGGGFTVTTNRGRHHARCVLLAMGRRGTPRKLEVPGEDGPQVTYRLVDPAQYEGQHVLVVGGGDSALEAALALAEQPGTQVTLAYRGAAFSRVKARNRDAMAARQAAGGLTVAMQTEVAAIEAGRVHLRAGAAARTIHNDAVIVCAGGELPIALLQRAGVAFDTHRGGG